MTHFFKRGKELINNYRFSLAIFLSVVIFVLASSGLVVANGETLRPDDSHIVNVSIDGQELVVPSRAANVGDLVSSLEVNVSSFDLVEPSLDTPIDSDNFRIKIFKAKPTTIVASEQVVSLMSPYEDDREAVKQAGIELHQEDIVDRQFTSDYFETKILGRKIEVKRAKIATINLYGVPIEKRTQSETVEEVLKELSITPAPDDVVTPAIGTMLTDKTSIFITKFGKQLVSSEEVVKFSVEVQEDPEMSTGAEKIIQPGVNGKKIVTYEIDLQNGVEVSRKVIQETVVTEAVVQKVIRGTKPLFADYNSDGIPARVFCGSPKQGNWKNINVGNAAAGRVLAAERGWTGPEFDALLELFACESSWNEKAGNPVSGAYGIPQSWPASKMSSFGEDYMTNPITQLRWGLNYIASRYGTPSQALAFHYRTNYY